MSRAEGNTSKYDQRLQNFLKEIDAIVNMNPRHNPMHDIMDSVPFKDLETALMMARMEHDPHYQMANG